MNVREQARKEVIAKVCPDDYDDRYLPSRLVDAANVASDIWEPFVRRAILRLESAHDVLQDHMFWAAEGDEGNNEDVCLELNNVKACIQILKEALGEEA